MRHLPSSQADGGCLMPKPRLATVHPLRPERCFDMPDRYGDEPTEADPNAHRCFDGWLNDRLTADNPAPCPVCKPAIAPDARREYLHRLLGEPDPAPEPEPEPLDWSGRRSRQT